jgi:chemotaxis protein histidine kinase CheA
MPLSPDDIIKYKNLYLQTARNYLQNMQLNISFLLKEEQADTAVKQVHIDAHSLKSQSQIMGYNHIAKVSEIIENLFNKQENENMQVNKDVLIQIQADLPRVQDSLTEIEKQGKELDLTGIIEKLEKVK